MKRWSSTESASLLHTGYAPAWYVRACVGFDLVIAAWIALRPDQETAP